MATKNAFYNDDLPILRFPGSVPQLAVVPDAERGPALAVEVGREAADVVEDVGHEPFCAIR